VARIHGRNGNVYMGVASSSATAEAIVGARKWTLNFSTDAQEATAYGDTNRVYVVGLPDCQGTVEGFYDNASAQTYTAASDGQARRVYFYPQAPSAAGPYWYGTAFFDFSVDHDQAGVVTFTANWRAASAFTKIG
jgi:hypothetical protein